MNLHAKQERQSHWETAESWEIANVFSVLHVRLDMASNWTSLSYLAVDSDGAASF